MKKFTAHDIGVLVIGGFLTGYILAHYITA
jgi:hypothetical protein